jgi:hypothetical protein
MDEMGRENLKKIQKQRFLEKMERKKRTPILEQSELAAEKEDLDELEDVTTQVTYKNLYSQAAELLSLCKLLYEQEMGRPGDRYEIFLLRGEFRPFFGFILI